MNVLLINFVLIIILILLIYVYLDDNIKENWYSSIVFDNVATEKAVSSQDKNKYCGDDYSWVKVGDTEMGPYLDVYPITHRHDFIRSWAKTKNAKFYQILNGKTYAYDAVALEGNSGPTRNPNTWARVGNYCNDGFHTDTKRDIKVPNCENGSCAASGEPGSWEDLLDGSKYEHPMWKQAFACSCKTDYCNKGYKISSTSGGLFIGLNLPKNKGEPHYVDPCTPCQPGTYSTDKNYTTECTLCRAGTYQNESGKSFCKQANIGHYATNGQQTQCGLGTYQDELESSSCNPCGLGTYQDERGSRSCKNCEAGTYQDEPGSSRCKNCEAGTYQDEPGSSSCTTCATVDNAATNADYTCTSATTSQLITACADGYWKDISGAADVCTACATVDNAVAGATYTCTSTADSQLSACAAGFWKDTTGAADVCTTCATVDNAATNATYTCTSASNSRVSACKAGFWKDIIGVANVCTEAEPGHYASDGQQQTQCEEGTYQNESGKTSCNSFSSLGDNKFYFGGRSTFCPDGYVSDTSRVQCVKNPRRRSNMFGCNVNFSNSDKTSGSANHGDVFDVICDVGYYGGGKFKCNDSTIDGSGNSKSCTACPAGTFQDESGRSSCKNCIAGTYQDEQGQISCKNCIAGTYQDEQGQISCKNCIAGTYQDEQGQTSCKTFCTASTPDYKQIGGPIDQNGMTYGLYEKSEDEQNKYYECDTDGSFNEIPEAGLNNYYDYSCNESHYNCTKHLIMDARYNGTSDDFESKCCREFPTDDSRSYLLSASCKLNGTPNIEEIQNTLTSNGFFDFYSSEVNNSDLYSIGNQQKWNMFKPTAGTA